MPPGSGEGDVPANILFLIDSSASMSRRISNRDAVFGMTKAIYDSNGDILGGQTRNLALVKFDADGKRNREFGNAARWTGAWNDTCEAGHAWDGTAGYSSTTRDTRTRSAAKLRLVENMSTNDGTITDENIVFFKCSMCDAVLKSNRNLNLHISAVHEGKRPHQCQICNASFTQTSHLKTHERNVHEKKRPHIFDQKVILE